MIKFIVLLIITAVAAGLWVVTAITMDISGQSYLNLTAPWWHVALHLLWLIAAFATSMVGVVHMLNRLSRRKLSHNPPQQT